MQRRSSVRSRLLSCVGLSLSRVLTLLQTSSLWGLNGGALPRRQKLETSISLESWFNKYFSFKFLKYCISFLNSFPSYGRGPFARDALVRKLFFVRTWYDQVV